MGVFAAGESAQRFPGLDRHFAVGFGRQCQQHLGGVDVGLDPGQALGRSFFGHDAVQFLQKIDFVLRVPAHAFAAVAELGHQRSERGEALVEVRIVALDDGDLRHRLAGNGGNLALLPVADGERLRDLAGGIVHDRGQHHVFFDAENFRRDLGKLLGDRLVDFPIALAFPHRIHRRRQRVNERVHVRRVEVVLFVPGGGRQHDVGIDAGGRHAEVERHQEVELSFRPFIMPGDLARLLTAGFAQVLAQHAVRRPEQVLEKIFVALA